LVDHCGDTVAFMCCPPNFPYVSSSNSAICYDNQESATAGVGGCGSWCTNDPDFGDGCGDRSALMC
jgi:hypothetical protein